jgi:hypothetical protein
MNQEELSPVAELLALGYLETRSHSRQFKDQWNYPLTVLAKAHYLRSVVQAEVVRTEGLLLSDEYAEFGRVEITDVSTGKRYLLKSETSVAIEDRLSQRESLFDPAPYMVSDVVILVYSFKHDGVELSLAGSVRKISRERLHVAGPPTFVGIWSYDGRSSQSFEQDDAHDAFGDLGDIDMDGEADHR